MNELINFLSATPFFESDKNLATYLDDFLIQQYLIKPLLFFSMQDKFKEIDFGKCRSVLKKADRIEAYNRDLLNKLIASKSEMKALPYLIVKIEDSYYYYLNFGIKRTQFFFSVFSSTIEIPSEVLNCLSKFISNHLKVIEKIDDLYKTQELIYVDDVTGLYNQRKLFKDLALLSLKFQKIKDPFCILFIDIDHFKKVNDNYGHLTGTKLLENVATDVKSLLREADLSYRYGGDEFVIILTDSDCHSGKIVGERILNKICSQIYSADVSEKQKNIKLSVSIGVAEFPADAKNPKEVLALADRMMYEAKESGRGLVFNTKDIFKSNLKKMVEQK